MLANQVFHMPLYSDWKILVYSLAFTLELCLLYPLLALIKWRLLKLLGIPFYERKIIFSNRKKKFDLAYFIEKYGDKNIRVVDGLSRKLLHIVAGCWQLLILNFVVRDPDLAFKATFVYQLCLVSLSLVCYSSNKLVGLAGVMYGASSRIRDGLAGRKNVLIARFSFLSLLPLALIENLAERHVTDNQELVIFSFFIFLPLTIGDALGEIIGTIWGKQKLKVLGIGEINRKSILGTLSVFLGGCLPLLYITYSNSLSLHWWVLSLIIATITTIIELCAPRGTDNFFIPLGNSLICLAFINLFGSAAMLS